MKKVAAIDSVIKSDEKNWEAPLYLTWDQGEVSGPYDNWQKVRLAVHHLVSAYKNLDDEQRIAFLSAIDSPHGFDWQKMKDNLESKILKDLQSRLEIK